MFQELIQSVLSRYLASEFICDSVVQDNMCPWRLAEGDVPCPAWRGHLFQHKVEFKINTLMISSVHNF